MYRITKLSLFILLLQSCLSCTPVLKLYYGTHNPRLESDKKISSYVEKLDLPEILQLVPKDSNAYFKILGQLEGLPHLQLYDVRGTAMTFLKPAHCNAPVDSISGILCTADLFQADSVLQLQALMSMLRPLNEKDSARFHAALNQPVQFTSISFWAKFIGHLNKSDVKRWVENSSSQKNCQVNAFMVNMDLREEFMSKDSYANF